MKSQRAKFMLTALGYIIPTMVLGILWHFILFEELYNRLGIYNRAEPIITLGFASMIIQGLIIAYLYPFYSAGKSSIGKSVKFNLVIGLLLYSVSTMANAAKIEVSSMQDWVGIQLIFHLIQFYISGLLIGWINKNK